MRLTYNLWKYKKAYPYLDPTSRAFSSSLLSPTKSDEKTEVSDDVLVAQHEYDATQRAGEQYGNTTGLHLNAFDNPATWKETPLIWMAEDGLGIAHSEVTRLEAESLKASTEYASMDKKAKRHVERGSPDEAW
ncbi:hypothetical protein CALVIDRAFT_601231 [Calocera viscosa TUFC12733]|uniref:10TM putative phosphate transporter extracellular tail domain-containing protein n=1 Tax=Calocera viscosa (strain TUFC12733) TaxID=1330018 RepID=A0A167ILZ1_CALVF|nr:hypothetical protein CALVIDRAFT_601231 [Calocera viscosa TUFC12733]